MTIQTTCPNMFLLFVCKYQKLSCSFLILCMRDKNYLFYFLETHSFYYVCVWFRDIFCQTFWISVKFICIPWLLKEMFHALQRDMCQKYRFIAVWKMCDVFAYWCIVAVYHPSAYINHGLDIRSFLFYCIIWFWILA